MTFEWRSECSEERISHAFTWYSFLSKLLVQRPWGWVPGIMTLYIKYSCEVKCVIHLITLAHVWNYFLMKASQYYQPASCILLLIVPFPIWPETTLMFGYITTCYFLLVKLVGLGNMLRGRCCLISCPSLLPRHPFSSWNQLCLLLYMRYLSLVLPVSCQAWAPLPPPGQLFIS